LLILSILSILFEPLLSGMAKEQNEPDAAGSGEIDHVLASVYDGSQITCGGRLEVRDGKCPSGIILTRFLAPRPGDESWRG
jgi:hypothetical protein